MSEKCRYVAIDGTVLKFGYDGKLFLGAGSLRDYLNTPYSPYGKILGFDDTEEPKQFEVPLYISAPKSESADIRNVVQNVFEKDVAFKNNNPDTQKSGRLYIGDYYLKCFVCGSSSSGYLSNNKFLKKMLTVVTDSPKWIKEVEFLFTALDESANSKSYPYSYPYQYGAVVTEQQMINSYMLPVNFELTIQAKSGSIARNPYILIGGNQYQFNIVLSENEKLVVNSLSQSITLIDGAGNQTDALYARDKSNDIFKKIPIGENAVSISSNTKVLLTLLFERSEPEWI